MSGKATTGIDRSGRNDPDNVQEKMGVGIVLMAERGIRPSTPPTFGSSHELY